MSSSEADWAALRELCARIDALVAGGRSAEAPDDVVTALLSTATRLYRDATHEGGRDIPAFSDAAMPATSVVVTVSAMLRAVGMNPFDLSMWFNRPGRIDADGGEGG